MQKEKKKKAKSGKKKDGLTFTSYCSDINFATSVGQEVDGAGDDRSPLLESEIVPDSGFRVEEVQVEGVGIIIFRAAILNGVNGSE